MTEQTPQQQLSSKISSLQYKVRNLQSKTRLTSLRDSVEDLDVQVNGLKQRVQDLRLKGYVFGKNLEAKAVDYARRWRTQRVSVVAEIDRQTPSLERELRPLESQLATLQARANNPTLGLPMAERLESSLENFNSKVSAVESSIRGMFDSLLNEVKQLKVEIDRIQWMLAQVAEACFQLLATEGGIMAVKATYSRDAKIDKEDPQGVLFLTDQRLIFEQKQEVATKKVLFFATEKQKVQQQLLEVPLALVEKVETSKKGLFGHQDHLTITFKSGAPVQSAWFHLDGQDCNWWNGLIGQACSGGFDKERIVEIDNEVKEKVKSAPSNCPRCGAPVTQVVLRGMDTLTCEYCQHVIRL